MIQRNAGCAAIPLIWACRCGGSSFGLNPAGLPCQTERAMETALQSFLERTRVLIPAFNEEASLPGLLAEVRAQLPGASVAVVDDGSTDGTYEVVEAVFAGDPRVRLRRKPNGGKASALNLALQDATAPLVVGVDADAPIGRVTQPERAVHWATRGGMSSR